jgi:hypothetical protein
MENELAAARFAHRDMLDAAAAANPSEQATYRVMIARVPPPSYLQIVEVSPTLCLLARSAATSEVKLITKLPYSGNTRLPLCNYSKWLPCNEPLCLGVYGGVVGMDDKSPTVSAFLIGIVVLGDLYWDSQQDTSAVVENKTN